MGVSSEPKGRGITVTIKYGKGYEQTWAVFHGLPDEVREDIVSFFGMQGENVVNLTLSDVVVNATSIAHGVGTIAATFGATVIASETRKPEPAAVDTGSDAWAQASAPRQADETPAANPVLASIAQAPDVPALQRIWAENQAAFADPAVMDAWKARGRALAQ